MKKFLINLINLHSRNRIHVQHIDRFMDSDRFVALPLVERKLMAKQSATMHELDAILSERLRIHGIEV
ncbi:MAG: hypothetical protein K2N25_04780 [Muribaculaceae bacterium]|nr:hypothetical protein [Muribaculaceae bacterium]